MAWEHSFLLFVQNHLRAGWLDGIMKAFTIFWETAAGFLLCWELCFW